MVEQPGATAASNKTKQIIDSGQINLDQLVHTKAFQTGYLTFDKCFEQVPGYVYGTKSKLVGFEENSSFLPFTATDYALYGPGKKFTDLTRTYLPGWEQRPEDDGSAYESKLSNEIDNVKNFITDHTKPVDIGKANLREKPVAVIYNPTSGRGLNIRERISTFLSEHGIESTFYETQRYMHAFELAGGEIDFKEHSALVAVGGDGTAHEVINGMLKRADGLKLPISFLPNGSGNDLVGCFGIKDIEQSLNWLVKGDIIKMDVNKVLMDHHHEDEIVDSETRLAKFRYSVINTACGFIAKVAHKAFDHKPIMGKNCYLTSAVINFFTTQAETLDLVLEQHDGSCIELRDERTMFLMCMNGKYAGGRMPMTPIASPNDGLLDLCLQHGPTGTKEMMSFVKNCVAGKGKHVYKDTYAYFRGRSLTIKNKNTRETTTPLDSTAAAAQSNPEVETNDSDDADKSQNVGNLVRVAEPQMFQIDGEALWFNDFVKIEVIPGAVDVLVDYQQMMEQKNLLRPATSAV